MCYVGWVCKFVLSMRVGVHVVVGGRVTYLSPFTYCPPVGLRRPRLVILAKGVSERVSGVGGVDGYTALCIYVCVRIYLNVYTYTCVRVYLRAFPSIHDGCQAACGSLYKIDHDK